jgi:uncharacterized protein YfeS
LQKQNIEDKRQLSLVKEQRLEEAKQYQVDAALAESKLTAKIQDRQRKRNERVAERTNDIFESYCKKEETYEATVYKSAFLKI